MPRQKPPSVSESITAITEGSKKIHSKATELSERILSFEKWLNSLPGRVDTVLNVDESDYHGEHFFQLRLHRSGKSWMISFDYVTPGVDDEDDESRWEPLKDASLETKLKAIHHFPSLLAEISKQQTELVERIEQANLAFDNFARALPTNTPEKTEGN